MDQTLGLLRLGAAAVAVLCVAGCTPCPSLELLIVNRAGVAVEEVKAAWEGGSVNVGRMEPMAEVRQVMRARSDSDVSIAYRVGGTKLGGRFSYFGRGYHGLITIELGATKAVEVGHGAKLPKWYCGL